MGVVPPGGCPRTDKKPEDTGDGAMEVEMRMHVGVEMSMEATSGVLYTRLRRARR